MRCKKRLWRWPILAALTLAAAIPGGRADDAAPGRIEIPEARTLTAKHFKNADGIFI